MISILIVEDEFITADFISDALKEIGYIVNGIASSAQECLDLLAAKKTDLVLLDINIIGDTNGIQLADKIRTKYAIPFVFLTSYLDKETVDAALKTEPSAYVTKPFNKVSLYTSIEVALKNFSNGFVATSAKNRPVSDGTFVSKKVLFYKHNKGSYTKIEVNTISYFHTELKHVDIYTPEKRHSIRYRLSDLLDKLEKDYFVQCHRSYAINLNKVKNIHSGTIHLEDGTMIPIGLSYKKAVIARLDLL